MQRFRRGAEPEPRVPALAVTTDASAPSTSPASAGEPSTARRRDEHAGRLAANRANPTARSTAGNPPATSPRLPVEPRFGPAWGDRSIYEPGLITSEQKVLNGLPGASEYRIDLRIDDSLTKVSGEQQVRYTNREDVPLNEIYLRLFPNALGGKMRVSDVTVDGVQCDPGVPVRGHRGPRAPAPATRGGRRARCWG